MPRATKPIHILEAQQFSRNWLEKYFFPEAIKMKRLVEVKGVSNQFADKTVCLLFYEPSTRTRISFQQACIKLGAKVVGTENAKEFSSAIKGESLIDTIRVANALQFDCVVLRSDETDGALKASEVSKIPVINAGDGSGQHPTQALLDLLTIYQHFKKIDNLKVALVGDLRNGRTTRSLAYLLGKFKGMEICLVSPDNLRMRNDILEYLNRHKVSYKKVSKLSDCASEVDVVYLTRAQTERMKGKQKLNGQNVSINEKVLEMVNPNSIILHPLPRSDGFNELPERFTDDPRVHIFDQVENGLYTRMALLRMVLS